MTTICKTFLPIFNLKYIINGARMNEEGKPQQTQLLINQITNGPNYVNILLLLT